MLFFWGGGGLSSYVVLVVRRCFLFLHDCCVLLRIDVLLVSSDIVFVFVGTNFPCELQFSASFANQREEKVCLLQMFFSFSL